MANMSNQDYLKVAVQAAKRSGNIFKKYFGRPEKVEKKNGNRLDLVTEVDKKIEAAISKFIHKRFPTHSILGEETGLTEQINEQKLVWAIDPIDGTTNYIQGVAECVISLALWNEHGPIAAVIYHPINNLMFTAAKGTGCFLNGKKIKVSGTKKIIDAFAGVGWNESMDKGAVSLFDLMKKHSRKIRILGSSALQLAYVSSGTMDCFVVKGIRAWDFAAGVLLIQEAGGKVTDFVGNHPTLDSRQLIASNGKLSKELNKILSAG
jgi:myo-inositol-1(or 4)-monophosphatase